MVTLEAPFLPQSQRPPRGRQGARALGQERPHQQHLRMGPGRRVK
jgi:hypothetical protein